MRPSRHHRRRGAAGGVPRPAASRSTPACPGMCTLHANSAREAVVKMCTLPLLAGENIGDGVRGARPSPRRVDLVVHLGIDATAHRRVREIVAVPGPGRGRRRRDRRPLRHAATGGWSAPTASRRTPSASSAPASTSPRCSATGHDVIRARSSGSLLGIGLLLRLAQRPAGAAAPRRRRAASGPRASELLAAGRADRHQRRAAARAAGRARRCWCSSSCC